MNWRAQLTPWQQDELELASFYRAHLNHGTSDHDRLVLIAILAHLLDLATGFGTNKPVREALHEHGDPANPPPLQSQSG